jgi:hypothetical protein
MPSQGLNYGCSSIAYTSDDLLKYEIVSVWLEVKKRNIWIIFYFGINPQEYFIGCINKMKDLKADVFKIYSKLIDCKGDV